MDRRKVTLVTLALGIVIGLAFLPSPSSAKEYVIGAADLIAISVLDNKELDTVVSVSPGGKIAVPLLGDMQAAGLTVTELTARLTEEFSKKVRMPQVTVTLREVNSYRLYFLGKIGRPGIHQSKSVVTLLQGISMAGGILEGADLDLAYVARGQARLPVNFRKLLREGDLSHNITLEPDDTVMIPDNPGNVFYVMGEVRQPGALPYQIERGWTALKAVAAVGGFTQFAARGKATLLREDAGRRVTIPIDFSEVMRNPAAGDIPLAAGDILVVPQSLF